MGSVVYGLCALTSVLCAILLLSAHDALEHRFGNPFELMRYLSQLPGPAAPRRRTHAPAPSSTTPTPGGLR